MNSGRLTGARPIGPRLVGRHAPLWLAQTGCTQICRYPRAGPGRGVPPRDEASQHAAACRTVTRRALVGHRAVTLPGQTSNDGDGRQLQSGSEQERRAVGGRLVIARRVKSAAPACPERLGGGTSTHRERTEAASSWAVAVAGQVVASYDMSLRRSSVEEPSRGGSARAARPAGVDMPCAGTPGFVGARTGVQRGDVDTATERGARGYGTSPGIARALLDRRSANQRADSTGAAMSTTLM